MLPRLCSLNRRRLVATVLPLAAGFPVVALSVVLAGPVSAVVTPTGTAEPCQVDNSHGRHIEITSPLPSATIDLGATPRFMVSGEINGSHNRKVARVEVYGDGALLGSATFGTAKAKRDQDMWQFATSAPAGTHTLVACAVGVNGPLSRTWG